MDSRLLHYDELGSRVGISSSEEIEIKLEYTLNELSKNNNYTVECYFFIPSNLNINPHTYSSVSFYHDIQNYLRFKTPVIKVSELIDPNFAKSPFNILNHIKGELSEGFSADKITRAIKELKMLGCIVRARIRDYEREVNELLEKKKVEEASVSLEQFSSSLFLALKKLRELKEAYKSNFPSQKNILKYFNIAEEFINNLIEFELVRIISSILDEFGNNIIKDSILNSIFESLEDEKDYRNRHKYRLHFNDEKKDKDRYLYYMNLYKKYLASTLFLNSERKRQSRKQSHVVASIAAFIASVISFLFTAPLMSSFSRGGFTEFLLFVILASIVYIFKDRIKEIVKLLWNPRVLSKFADYDTKIYDSDNDSVEVGNLREKFKFVSKDEVDPTVLSMREETRKRDYLAEEIREDIILYQKEINIDVRTILGHHTRTVDITDIVRYNLRQYLPRMSDPVEDIYFFDEKKKQLCKTSGSRCYFINLVIKYKTSIEKDKERRHYERYRIVVRKSGIERIELVNWL